MDNQNQFKMFEPSSVTGKCSLPKYYSKTNLPTSIANEGITENASDADMEAVRLYNNAKFTRSIYEKLGIKILAEQELFYEAELPAGWSIRATDHPMWSQLVDDKNRVRGVLFYKATLLGSGAFICLQTRYTYDVLVVGAAQFSWGSLDLIGLVKDCEDVIHRTRPIPCASSTRSQIYSQLSQECESYLDKELPEWRDVHAYWD